MAGLVSPLVADRLAETLMSSSGNVTEATTFSGDEGE
jgi:hypothetical protein